MTYEQLDKLGWRTGNGAGAADLRHPVVIDLDGENWTAVTNGKALVAVSGIVEEAVPASAEAAANMLRLLRESADSWIGDTVDRLRAASDAPCPWCSDSGSYGELRWAPCTECVDHHSSDSVILIDGAAFHLGQFTSLVRDLPAGACQWGLVRVVEAAGRRGAGYMLVVRGDGWRGLLMGLRPLSLEAP